MYKKNAQHKVIKPPACGSTKFSQISKEPFITLDLLIFKAD
jgi:hypothetical protein